MRIHTFTTSTGEEIEMRELDDGSFVCPVCGCVVRHGPVWDWLYPPSEKDPATGHNWAIGSLDICRCCNTQWGADDWVGSPDPDATKKRWAELRAAWLAKVGRTKAVVEQLRNLGIELAVDDEAGGDDPTPGNAADRP